METENNPKERLGSESGHWYDENGLVEEVIGSKGMPVKPSLVHARKLNLLPSVSSILGVLPSPELEIWKCKQWALAAMDVPMEEGEETVDWLARVKQFLDEKLPFANIGRGWHKDLQISLQAVVNKDKEGVIDRCKDLVAYLTPFVEQGKFVFLEKPFANYSLGYGGTIDAYFETDTDVYIFDYKTVDDEKIKADRFFRPPKHLMQLVAYYNGVGNEWGEAPQGKMKPATLVNIYIGRDSGEFKVVEHDPDDFMEAQKKFKACFDFWCAIKNYKPNSK